MFQLRQFLRLRFQKFVVPDSGNRKIQERDQPFFVELVERKIEILFHGIEEGTDLRVVNNTDQRDSLSSRENERMQTHREHHVHL